MISKIEGKIKIKFSQPQLLNEAFTHRSYLNEHHDENLPSNERLEFLGDSILQFCISNELFKKFPDVPEGILTNMRTRLVRTETLAQIAQTLNLGDFLKLSHGEEKGGGRQNQALLANTFEALLGAIYLDKSLAVAQRFLLKNFQEMLDQVKNPDELKDAKSLLQERIQVKVKESPEYRVIKESGPDHNKIFEIEVLSQGKVIGLGTGKSKQQAEENAAKDALEKTSSLG